MRRDKGALMRRRWIRGAALLALAAIVAAGCGSDRKDDKNANGDNTTTTAASSEKGTFGNLDSPCGKGDAKGATDVGVADTEITIGYGDDAGYQASPGLNHEMSDAM